jgi:[ribosomal protein S5]-alanine N-acetyltransferase
VLTGKHVTLRQFREADLDEAWAHHANIANRGEFYPLGVVSEPAFRSRFGETGFWQREEGVLLITGNAGEIAGEIEFFKPVHYWDAFELSYLLYDAQYAGRGYVTEAVQLMTDYLFGAKKPNRIQLVIVPENSASRRIAEKCGFVLEGTVRGAFFNRGRNNDVLLYSLLRDDPRPWHDGG